MPQPKKAAKKVAKKATRRKTSDKTMLSGPTNPINETLCRKFKEVRVSLEMTQQQYADMLGVQKNYVNAVENKFFSPSPAILYWLAVNKGYSMDWFFGIK